MGLEAPPHVGDEGGVFRDLGRQRVNSPRGVKELPRGPGDRPDADENVAGPEKPAERLAVQGVVEVGRVRPGDQLFVRALRDDGRRSVVSHERGGVETERLGPRTEVFLELRGVRLEQHAAARKIAGGQLHVAQKRPALRFAVKLGRLIGFGDKGCDVAHEARVDRPLDGNRSHDRGDDSRDGGDQ